MTEAWFQDPLGRHEWRYFDGQNWTDHVADHGQTGRDPLDDSPCADRETEQTPDPEPEPATQHPWSGDDLIVTSKTKSKSASKVIEGSRSWLRPGEQLVLITTTNSIRPMFDALVVTEDHLVGIDLTKPQIPKISLDRPQILSFQIRRTLGARARLLAVLQSGEEISCGDIHSGGQEQEVHARLSEWLLESPRDGLATASIAAPAHQRPRQQELERLGSEKAEREARKLEVTRAKEAESAKKHAELDARRQEADERLRSEKAEREARKLEATRARVDQSRKKHAELDARRQEDLERFGRAVACEAFGGKVITIYQRGFVKVGGLFGGGTQQQLISIDASADVGKKSGLGRGAAAVVTGGFNLLGSNKRGDVYLTIVTEAQTYALRETPPTAGNMTRSKKLEGAGRGILKANPLAMQSDSASAGVGVRERMNELKGLLADGLISEAEFEQKRKALLDGL